MRQPTPAANVQMNERVYAMDVKHPVLAVATATVPETVVERGVSRVDKKNKIMVRDYMRHARVVFSISFVSNALMGDSPCVFATQVSDGVTSS